MVDGVLAGVGVWRFLPEMGHDRSEEDVAPGCRPYQVCCLGFIDTPYGIFFLF